MIETITYNSTQYPAFQAEGNAAQFAIPFAKHVCSGVGYDIGCKRVDWSFPNSIPIDPVINPEWEARQLPDQLVDYIFSSHCLEHINDDWFRVLQYWLTKIKKGGTLFLYLPDYSQEYWRPWNNTKHVHVFTPEIIQEAFIKLGLHNVFVSGVDLNSSFMAMGQV